jgi:hypothetical protein
MPARSRWILGFAVATFAFARLAGAHVHLCFDGAQEPLALHTAGTADVDDHRAESPCLNDVDVDPVGDGLSKIAKSDLPAVAIVAAVRVAFIGQTRATAMEDHSARLPQPLRRFIVPPLRAPPI